MALFEGVKAVQSEMHMRGPYLFADLARQSRENWPVVNSEFYFIWEALDRVGKAKFPDEWDGMELFARDWPDHPAFDTLSIDYGSYRGIVCDKDTLAEELAKARAAANNEAIAELQAIAAQFRQLDEATKAYRLNEGRCSRVNAVVNILAQAARDDRITCYTQFAGEGGKPIPMHGPEWGVKMESFEWSHIHPLNRFFAQGGHLKDMGAGFKVLAFIFMQAYDIDDVIILDIEEERREAVRAALDVQLNGLVLKFEADRPILREMIERLDAGEFVGLERAWRCFMAIVDEGLHAIESRGEKRYDEYIFKRMKRNIKKIRPDLLR